MAKVKIQGHASGTGVLTVTAPNTSTDRTITLPDATGTLLNSDGDGSSLTGVGVAGITSAADATAINILSNERVGINKTTPEARLDISAASETALRAVATVSGEYAAVIQSASTNTTPILSLRKSGGTETVRFSSEGGILFNGDTAAANALDDYEEGAWTPSGTNVATSSVGLYTKIGNMCFIQGWLIASGGATGSDISGLPFASGNGSSNAVGGGTVLYSNDTITGLYVNGGGATTFHLFNRAANAVITNTSQMHFTLAYRTT